MEKKNYKLNATAASLLGFLHEGPMSGWDLVALANDRIGNFWNLTKSQVYRELQALADAKLVTTGERDTREKRIFTITQSGRDAFAIWLNQEPAEEIIRYPLLLSTSFSNYMAPGMLQEFVRQHRSAHEARLKKYRQEKERILQSEDTTDKSGLLLTFSFGIQYEEMVLAWMDDVLKS